MLIYEALPRSILLDLKPVDSGKGFMHESVSSYIVRLAYAHNVTARDFMHHFLNPSIGQNRMCSNFFVRNGFSMLNGYRTKAEIYTHALSVFTDQPGLRVLSMQPWQSLLDSMGKGLFHDSKKWCQFCLQDWWEKGHPLYEPLIWSLKCLEHCPIHECKLQTICHKCGAKQYQVQRVLPLGFCPECGSFLGRRDHNSRDKQPLALKEQYLLDLVSSRHIVQENDELLLKLRTGIQQVMSCLNISSTIKLEKLIQFSKATISQWCSDAERGTKPTLSTLLNFCVAINVSPSDLIFSHHRIKPVAGTAILDGRKRFDNSDKYSWVKQQLIQTINCQTSIISINEMARQLKVGKSYIRYHFPDISEELVAKNNQLRKTKRENDYKRKYELVKSICQKLMSEEIFPSHTRVEEALKEQKSDLGYDEFTRIRRSVMRDI
ncbi:TniQ family protein [Endozoicomonas ascidiicola]|uniref:TniQ family protein n=1 Tax=Endozoicomonas ascidiicola TaxID=1698521 RepID=UPI0008320EC9|nr:TniQ family protein [Endozoicomonas ascidiicola]